MGDATDEAARRIHEYINDWKAKGYHTGIPDEVPTVLMRQNLAPSYKAIAIAILNNDLKFMSLGFSGVYTGWYSAFKKIEIAARPIAKTNQMILPLGF